MPPKNMVWHSGARALLTAGIKRMARLCRARKAVRSCHPPSGQSGLPCSWCGRARSKRRMARPSNCKWIHCAFTAIRPMRKTLRGRSMRRCARKGLKSRRCREAGLTNRMDELKIRAMGDAALSVELGNVLDVTLNARVHALARQMETAHGVTAVVPGYTTLLVEYDPEMSSEDALTEQVRRALQLQTDAEQEPARVVEIPVHYGGAFGPD